MTKLIEKEDGADGSSCSSDSLKPKAPDGGWGWAVAFASFMVSLCVDGIGFSFGIFLPEFENYFGGSKGKTTMILSVFVGSYLTFGPVIGALVNKFGCRKVALVGALTASLGLFLSTFSPNLDVMIFLYGFIGGFGFGLVYLPAFIMVSLYFDKRRALATGIVCCGSGIGGFIFPPMSAFLLESFGWKGSMWIIAGICFHTFAFSWFYRPLDVVPKKKNLTQLVEEYGDPQQSLYDKKPNGVLKSGNDDHEKEDETFCSIKEPLVNDFKLDANHVTDADSEQDKRLMLQVPEADDITKSDHTLHPIGRQQRIDPTKNFALYSLYRCKSVEIKFSPREINDCARLAYSQDLSELQREELKREREKSPKSPFLRKDLFYSGSLKNIPDQKFEEDEKKYLKEVTREEEDVPHKDENALLQIVKAIKTSFDFTLLLSPTFLVYGVSCFLCMFGFFTPFTYLPNVASDLNLTVNEGALLLSIIGITNTVGRVGVGFVSDQPWADCLLINNVALVIGGVATIFVPFYNAFWILGVYSVVFGMAIAAFISLRSIIMVELLGLDRLTSAFALVVLAQGTSCYFGPPITGLMYDITFNYNVPFYVSGCTLALSGLICFPLRKISNWEKSRHKKKENDLESQSTEDNEQHSMLKSNGHANHLSEN